MSSKILEKINQNNPIVHCITNAVTVNDCANALLAIGASPTMAHHIAEVEEITAGCQALVCNLGATEYFDAMLVAAKRASDLRHPIIVDPVGISGSAFRRNMLLELMDVAQISCIRGNYSEIRALVTNCGGKAGVDADKKDAQLDSAFIGELQSFAAQKGLILIASGREDIVTDGKKITTISGGHELMSKITGTGCMSSALLGAVFAVDSSMDAAAWLCSYMKSLGEQAALATHNCHGGTMTFRQLLIDDIGAAFL